QIIARAAVGMGEPTTPDLFHTTQGKGKLDPVPEFREALLAVAGKNGAVDTQKFGNYLGTNKGRIVEGRRLVRAGLYNGNQRWKREPVATEKSAAGLSEPSLDGRP